MDKKLNNLDNKTAAKWNETRARVLKLSQHYDRVKKATEAKDS